MRVTAKVTMDLRTDDESVARDLLRQLLRQLELWRDHDAFNLTDYKMESEYTLSRVEKSDNFKD